MPIMDRIDGEGLPVMVRTQWLSNQYARVKTYNYMWWLNMPSLLQASFETKPPSGVPLKGPEPACLFRPDLTGKQITSFWVTEIMKRPASKKKHVLSCYKHCFHPQRHVNMGMSQTRVLFFGLVSHPSEKITI